MAANEGESAVGLGLRVATASTGCLIVGELFHLEQTSLSVYTAHLVMTLFPISSFQKGVERFVGRTLGILYGLALVRLFLNVPFLYLALVMIGAMVGCYI